MKKWLLATVTSLALGASGGFAVAQSGKEQPGDTGSGGAQMKDRSGGQSQTTGSGGSMSPGAEQKDKGSAKERQKSQAPREDIERRSGDQQRGTTGQGAQQERGVQQQPGAQQPGARQPGMQQPRGDTTTTGQGAAAPTGGSVNLTQEQKTKVRTTVINKGPKVERSKINFSLNVGTVVPRATVRLVAVPATLVEIRPAWRGYLYFVVDDEIVIVHPRTLAIVAVIEV
jgi:hypothetical protein